MEVIAAGPTTDIRKGADSTNWNALRFDSLTEAATIARIHRDFGLKLIFPLSRISKVGLLKLALPQPWRDLHQSSVTWIVYTLCFQAQRSGKRRTSQARSKPADILQVSERMLKRH